MRRFAPILTLVAGAAWACGGANESEMQPGAEVTIETADGSIVTGRVAQPNDSGESATLTGQGKPAAAASAPSHTATHPDTVKPKEFPVAINPNALKKSPSEIFS